MALPRSRTATKTIAAAGNYDANDVLSDSATDNAGTPFEFEKIAPRHGHPFLISSALIKCSEDATAFRGRLHLFNAEPLAAEVEMDDTAAFAIKTSAGSDKYLGYIDFPALADMGTLPSMGQSTQVDMMVDPDNQDTLWGVLQTLDAETNETASMTISITLNAEP